jgi:hypothetical protein
MHSTNGDRPSRTRSTGSFYHNDEDGNLYASDIG